MDDIPQVIDLASIELTGSECRTEQEFALRQKLKTEPFAVMVRDNSRLLQGLAKVKAWLCLYLALLFRVFCTTFPSTCCRGLSKHLAKR